MGCFQFAKWQLTPEGKLAKIWMKPTSVMVIWHDATIKNDDSTIKNDSTITNKKLITPCKNGDLTNKTLDLTNKKFETVHRN